MNVLPRLPGQWAMSPDDCRDFQFFQISTATELAGEFGGDFWGRLILQISHREECVRHMILAFSSLHRSMYIASLGVPSDRAASHYARALRSLNGHIIFNKGAALDITLLCSILCVTFEWLRANYSAALVHLRAGMKLLQEWHEASMSNSSALPRTSFWSPSGHLIRSTLSPFYTRLFVQAQSLLRNHGLSLPPAEIIGEYTVRPFANLNEARDSLYELLSEAYDFKPRPKRRRRKGSNSTRRLPAGEVLARWSTRLDEFFARVPEIYNSPAALALRVWRETTNIMVGVKNSRDESDFDKYTPGFSRIIRLANEYYTMNTSIFSADISIVAILYYVGAKCRNPLLRRRALALLTGAQRREGIWDSTEAARIVKALLDTEEGRATKRILVETDLGRETRVVDFAVNLDDERGVWTLDFDQNP